MILTMLPIFFLLLGAGGVLFIQRFRPSLGISWLAALLGALASWGILLVYRWVPPDQWIIRDWLQVGGRPVNLVFGFDPITWQFAFIVATILLTIMLTAPVRLGILKDPREWALDLSLTGAALIPVVAQNPLSLILSWTVLDLIEIIFYLSITTENRLSRQAIMAFSSRLAGTLMVFWAFLSTQLSGNAVVNFSEIAPQVGLLYLLAVGLRLGVFPVVVHFSTEMPVRREQGTLLRFTVPASSLVLLARLTGLVMPSNWAIFLSIISLLAVFYGVIRYLLSSSEITGRPFWLMALAGMAVVSVVRFQGEAVLAWSQVMMLMGTFLSLYSYRRSSYWWLLIIGFVGVTGLPFTPASSGWAGLVALPFNLLDFLFIAAHAGLLMGYLKHAFRQEPADQNLEKWMLALYPLGFVILVGVQWFLGIESLAVSFTDGIWWASIISVGAALVLIVVVNRVFRNGFDINIEDSSPHQKWLGFNWIYNSLQYGFLSLQSLILSITRILEGEGAILWAILLLLVFLSLVPFLGVQ